MEEPFERSKKNSGLILHKIHFLDVSCRDMTASRNLEILLYFQLALRKLMKPKQ